MAKKKLDLNQIFSYKTDLEVTIPTRLFGILYKLTQLAILALFIVQVIKLRKLRGEIKYILIFYAKMIIRRFFRKIVSLF